MNALPISDADLHAYVDGRLARERLAAVEEALARDAALAQRVADYRAQNAGLHDMLDPWLNEAIPSRLLAAATQPANVRSRRWWPALAAAASLVVGVALGWFARDVLLERGGTPTTFARQAVFAHVIYAADARRPVEVQASEAQSLVNWLTKRVGQPAHAPDLSSMGFQLVGGRLVAGNEKPAALLMYENADRQRLTLQWRKLPPGNEETAFRYAVENGVGVFYWIDDDCAYAIVGRVDRGQLLAAARVVYGQLAEPKK
jgi:anti-sigma factor RsiW